MIVASLALAAHSGVPNIVSVPVTLAIVCYVLTPLLILALQTQRANPAAVQLRSFDEVKRADLNTGLLLEGAASELGKLGFRTGMPVKVEMSAASTGFAIVGEASNGDVAEAYVLVRSTPDRTMRTAWVNVHSDTRTFRQTVTSNMPSITGIPTIAGNKAVRAFGVTDFARLYALHELAVRDAGGRRPSQGRPLDHAAYVAAETERGSDNMCAHGWAWRTGANRETLRLTPKGAFLMVWYKLPPLRQLAAARVRRELAALEERLGRDARSSRAA